jgi:methyl coenzyme M reductase subunit D
VQRYSTLSLSDVYSAIGYYLRHQKAVEAYLNYREQLADSVRQRLLDMQPDLSFVRSRLLAKKNLEG